MISSLLELLGCLLVELIIKPLLLVKLCFQFGVRSLCLVVLTWIELLRYVIHLHLIIFWKLLIWATGVFSLPARAFTALNREKLLEMQLYRMKIELDDVLWERKELEGLLRDAKKECRMVEMMLKELEDEHDKAIVKIELLEGKVCVVKKEMEKLKEVQGKALRDNKVEGDAGNGYNIKKTKSLWKFGNNKSTGQQIVHEDLYEPDHNFVKSEKFHGPDLPHNTDIIPKNVDILAKQRVIARSRSLFSAILSFVVGIIVWKAEDPCMPLVVALFTDVFMSLTSVVRFFSTIEHKPASEVVALLSFNWFILGTLTYPTLPKVARGLSPLASVLMG